MLQVKVTTTELKKGFLNENYICEDHIITTVFLALRLGKPLLITGAPGVGKTEIAKVLAKIFQTELIRLQCYEGLDENKAIYEWNYQKQLLTIQIKSSDNCGQSLEKNIFSEEFLLARPLLKAIKAKDVPVLLIDEIDKTDEEFEAFLYEVLSDFQISIPEMGTIKANKIPIVVLTSNGERDLSDGLKRRCVFLYIDYPTIEKEVQIIRAKIPDIEDDLAMKVAKAMNMMRQLAFSKPPAISEALDWARALVELEVKEITSDTIDMTLNLLLKSKEDQDKFRREADFNEFTCSINE